MTASGTSFATAPAYQWGYNAAGELTQANDTSTANNDRAFQFDGIGNREKTANGLIADLPASTQTYSVDALNQYTATPAAATLAYDADGNMTSGPLPAHTGGNSTLTWDGENRLISVTVNGTTTTYRYDHQSRRISKTSSATTTRYIYDGWNIISEYTGTTLTKSYTWGMDLSGSMQGAGGVGGLLSVELHTGPDVGTYYPTYDGNGNISEYLNSSGAKVAHYEYDAFGNEIVAATSGSLASTFSHRFSTKPLDAETGLYYYGYRYYDPVTGRWPSRDPIQERGGINLYGFVGNRPIDLIDRLGREPDIGGPFDPGGGDDDPFAPGGGGDPFVNPGGNKPPVIPPGAQVAPFGQRWKATAFLDGTLDADLKCICRCFLGLSTASEDLVDAEFCKKARKAFMENGLEIVLNEIMPVEENLRTQIMEGASATIMKRSAVERGMVTLREDGRQKILSGHTTADEVLRVTQLDFE